MCIGREKIIWPILLHIFLYSGMKMYRAKWRNWVLFHIFKIAHIAQSAQIGGLCISLYTFFQAKCILGIHNLTQSFGQIFFSLSIIHVLVDDVNCELTLFVIRMKKKIVKTHFLPWQNWHISSILIPVPSVQMFLPLPQTAKCRRQHPKTRTSPWLQTQLALAAAAIPLRRLNLAPQVNHSALKSEKVQFREG